MTTTRLLHHTSVLRHVLLHSLLLLRILLLVLMVLLILVLLLLVLLQEVCSSSGCMHAVEAWQGRCRCIILLALGRTERLSHAPPGLLQQGQCLALGGLCRSQQGP